MCSLEHLYVNESHKKSATYPLKLFFLLNVKVQNCNAEDLKQFVYSN